MEEPIRRAVTIDADEREIWAAITDEGALADWFGATVEMDLRLGGSIRFTWPDGRERRGLIMTLDPPRAFAFRWRDVAVGSTIETSVVAFALDPDGNGTRVEVT